jgi:hypothetical protein
MFLIQKPGFILSLPCKLLFPGGMKERYEYSIEACKRKLSQQSSVHGSNLNEPIFAGWIESFNPRYPSRVCFVLEVTHPISAHPSKGHESEVDMTWLNDYDCKGHAWLTYDQIDSTQCSNDITKMLAVAYKWSKNYGVDMGLPSFLGDEVISIVQPDDTREAFHTALILRDWGTFFKYDVVQSDARRS